MIFAGVCVAATWFALVLWIFSDDYKPPASTDVAGFDCDCGGKEPDPKCRLCLGTGIYPPPLPKIDTDPQF